MKSGKLRSVLSLLVFFSLVGVAVAGTEVSLWRSYTNQSNQVYRAFDLRNVKQGVFFGSCGLSTRSLQWEYAVQLKGAAEEYAKDAIELKDGNFQPMPVDSGSIVVNDKKSTVHIAIKISTNGVAQDFIGNGTYKLRSKP